MTVKSDLSHTGDSTQAEFVFLNDWDSNHNSELTHPLLSFLGKKLIFLIEAQTWGGCNSGLGAKDSNSGLGIKDSNSEPRSHYKIQRQK